MKTRVQLVLEALGTISPKFRAHAVLGSVPTIRPDLGPCWLWTGTIDRYGYGQYAKRAGSRLAHVIAFRLLIGSYEKPQLDHLCRVRRCVNPRHLEPVTDRENKRRGAHATKTHCARGHTFTSENTRITKNGWRRCRICERRWSAKDRPGQQNRTSRRR